MLGKGVGSYLWESPCCALCLSFPGCKMRGWVTQLHVPCDDSLMLPLGFWRGSHSFHGI